MNYLKSFLATWGFILLVGALITGLAWAIMFYTAYVLAVVTAGVFLVIWILVHSVIEDITR
jgi:hypothetical protein